MLLLFSQLKVKHMKHERAQTTTHETLAFSAMSVQITFKKKTTVSFMPHGQMLFRTKENQPPCPMTIPNALFFFVRPSGSSAHKIKIYTKLANRTVLYTRVVRGKTTRTAKTRCPRPTVDDCNHHPNPGHATGSRTRNRRTTTTTWRKEHWILCWRLFSTIISGHYN